LLHVGVCCKSLARQGFEMVEITGRGIGSVGTWATTSFFQARIKASVLLWDKASI